MTIDRAINQLKTFEPKHINTDIHFFDTDYEAIQFAIVAMELLRDIYKGAINKDLL